MTSFVRTALLLCVLTGACVAAADDLVAVSAPLDLTAFSAANCALVDDTTTIIDTAGMQPVSLPEVGMPARFYVTGIVGASFATLANGGDFEAFPGNVFSPTGSVNDTLFTGGGAVGLAFDRPWGQLRMELEGRGRGQMGGPTTMAISGGTLIDRPMTTTASGIWSFMTNFWRDYDLTEAFSVYGGGGIGIGGYRYETASLDPDLVVTGANTVNSFAWQVGTGVAYQVSRRVTIDVGYRFFSIGSGSTPLLSSDAIDGGAPYLFIGNSYSTFTASELLLSVRIYEPFRGLWR